jgi:hypothetical protein
MASKKDMRRVDLVIPYVEPPAEKESDFSSTFSSTMPMAAVNTSLQDRTFTALIAVLDVHAKQRPRMVITAGHRAELAI